MQQPVSCPERTENAAVRRDLSVTKLQQRSAVAIRKAVQLTTSKIHPCAKRVTQERPRERFGDLVCIVGSSLRKIENVDSYGVIRQDRQLPDGAGGPKRAEAVIGRLDYL